MKLSKIFALALALTCLISMLVSCDLEGIGDMLNGGKTPETPKEYFEYSYDYMQSHPYKQTTVTTIVMNGVSTTDESVSNMDGPNYYLENDGMISILYDNTLYVQTATEKKKMDMTALGDEYAMVEDYIGQVNDSLADADITLTKNDDGTTTLEFSISIDYAGRYDYVVTLDNNNRAVEYLITNEMNVMNYSMNTTYEITIEYGEQYKVLPPEDPDSYKTVDSVYDLVS